MEDNTFKELMKVIRFARSECFPSYIALMFLVRIGEGVVSVQVFHGYTAYKQRLKWLQDHGYIIGLSEMKTRVYKCTSNGLDVYNRYKRFVV